MQRALMLAESAVQKTTPNPSVGCVLVRDGIIIGEGVTCPAGGAHAEIAALTAARTDHAGMLEGATAYVTLEPCSHFGRTPPCADALIAAKIARVVVGIIDPNPEVSGRGLAIMRKAGIDITCVPETHPLFRSCEHHHRGFLKRMRFGMPYVTLKLASSIDGRIATQSGHSQWISCAASRLDVHRLRAESCAVLTSSSTVLADNPRLTARLSGQNLVRQPLRALIDRTLKVPVTANIFAPTANICVYHDAEIFPLSSYPAHVSTCGVKSKQEKLDLHAICSDLARRFEINTLLIEAGAAIAGSFLEENLVDELILYQAPIILGHEARASVNMADVMRVDNALSLCLRECGRIGNDIKMTYIRR